jgi:mannose PTS system EIIA component
MPAFLIVAHAPLASSLKAVAEHAYAECAPELVAIDVAPEEDADTLQARLQAAIGDAEAIVFTDMFGASPCNAARRVSEGRRVRVIAGVNVPMLWRTLCYRSLGLDELVEKALEGGVKGVLAVPPPDPLPP